MIDATDAADVLVNPDGGDDSALDFDELAAERWIATMERLTLAALVGVATAVVIAVALSWFTPVGPARYSEPHRGWSVNLPILLEGGACSASPIT